MDPAPLRAARRRGAMEDRRMAPTTRWPMSRRTWFRWVTLAGLGTAGGALGGGCSSGGGAGSSTAEADLDAFVATLSLDEKVQ